MFITNTGKNVDVYPSNFPGEIIDAAIEKILNLNALELTGWIKIISTEEKPINLNRTKNIGSYIVDYYKNGPSEVTGLKPIHLHVLLQDSKLYQIVQVGYQTFRREYNCDEMKWTKWIPITASDICLDDGRSIQEAYDDLGDKLASTTASFHHEQEIPSNVWNIPHGLGVIAVNVVIRDDEGDLILGYVDYNASDKDNLVIRFDIPIRGTVDVKQ